MAIRFRHAYYEGGDSFFRQLEVAAIPATRDLPLASQGHGGALHGKVANPCYVAV